MTIGTRAYFQVVLRVRPVGLDWFIQRMVAKHRAIIFLNEEIMTGREPTVVISTTSQDAALEIREELQEYR